VVCITNIDWKQWRHEKPAKTQNHQVFAGHNSGRIFKCADVRRESFTLERIEPAKPNGFLSTFGPIQEGDRATFSAVGNTRWSTYLIFTAFLTAKTAE
jgi:hypothetical protein